METYRVFMEYMIHVEYDWGGIVCVILKQSTRVHELRRCTLLDSFPIPVFDDEVRWNIDQVINHD